MTSPLEPTPRSRSEVDLTLFAAVLFDLDGVVTDTAGVHATAWKSMFDDFLAGRTGGSGENLEPFDASADYLAHVDGKPRDDGVRDFLTARGIVLDEGTLDSPATEESVHGLGTRKNDIVRELLRSGGVRVISETIDFVRKAQRAGLGTAVVSSSRDTEFVLQAAGLADLFPVRVDGVVRDDLGLAGKPAPDTYLEACRRLGVAADLAVVVEDAVSGVTAGVAGGFGLVIGVADPDRADALAAAGADVVVADLAELGR